MVDREQLPRPAPELSEDGVPAVEELPESVLLTGDPVEGDMPPLDRPQAVKDWGTTTSEQLGTETLERRLAREEPDTGVTGAAIGEAGVGMEDTLSAEEAAMSVVDDPPGLNDNPDPGYVDHDREENA